MSTKTFDCPALLSRNWTLARRVNHDGIFWQLNIAQFTERFVTLTVGQALERAWPPNEWPHFEAAGLPLRKPSLLPPLSRLGRSVRPCSLTTRLPTH